MKVGMATWFLKGDFLQTIELSVKKIVGVLRIVARFVEGDETTTVVENVGILGRVAPNHCQIAQFRRSET